jgi:two-component system, chemotaxis family, chemotaxis protein CheY
MPVSLSVSSISPALPAVHRAGWCLACGPSCGPPVDDPPGRGHAPRPVLRPVPPSPSARETVLVVDDDRQVRAILRAALEDLGFSVLEAGDGLEALEVLEALRAVDGDPLVALTDYRMPRMDGGALLQTVLRDPALAGRHAFALMTAIGEWLPAPLLALLAERAIPVLAKPFQLAEVEDVVRGCAARG